MKAHYLIPLCAVLIIGTMLIATPTTVAGMADEKTLISDPWLTLITTIALASDAKGKGWQIDVETTEGVVMLRGKVDSGAAKHAAEDIANMLNGVNMVKNDLEVIAPSQWEAGEDTDETITAQMK